MGKTANWNMHRQQKRLKVLLHLTWIVHFVSLRHALHFNQNLTAFDTKSTHFELVWKTCLSEFSSHFWCITQAYDVHCFSLYRIIVFENIRIPFYRVFFTARAMLLTVVRVDFSAFQIISLSHNEASGSESVINKLPTNNFSRGIVSMGYNWQRVPAVIATNV